MRRNLERVPEDFMFQLTRQEFLRCQNVTSSWGGRRYLPYAFTEQGVAMLSSVLNSKRAIQVNIGIMRVFVNIRKLVSANRGILNKLNQLEYKVQSPDKKSEPFLKVSINHQIPDYYLRENRFQIKKQLEILSVLAKNTFIG